MPLSSGCLVAWPLPGYRTVRSAPPIVAAGHRENLKVPNWPPRRQAAAATIQGQSIVEVGQSRRAESGSRKQEMDGKSAIPHTLRAIPERKTDWPSAMINFRTAAHSIKIARIFAVPEPLDGTFGDGSPERPQSHAPCPATSNAPEIRFVTSSALPCAGSVEVFGVRATFSFTCSWRPW